MTVQELDVVLRAGAGAQLLLLAVMLLREAPRERLTWLFAPLALCFCGFLAGNTPDPVLRLSGFVGQGAHLLSGYTAVFLWWFCLGVFDSSFRVRGLALAVGIIWIVIASMDRGVFGPALKDGGLSWVLVTLGLGIVAHIGWRLMADREGDLVEGRRKARALVATFLAAQLLVDAGVDLVFGLEWCPRSFTLVQNGAVLVFGLWVGAMFLRMSVAAGHPAAPDPELPRANAHPAIQDPAEARLAERLRVLLEIERVHLQPSLTFAEFVARMGASERSVRALINHRMGHDHFRAFLNTHRVAEACRLLRDPGRAEDKLISVAFDSGFASLASFNRAFRADKGCSPSQYRARLADEPAGRPEPVGR